MATNLETIDARWARAKADNPANKIARQHLVEAHCTIETSSRNPVTESHLLSSDEVIRR